ncbi:MAG: beta-lactamase family protein [Clostridia bacterium]|nr:beta-lactamase family protein [Clostridia bacterium]
MSKFIDDCAEFIAAQSLDITRVSVYKDGMIETAECVPANPCQNCYSVAKAFTMTAIGLLYDKGMIRLDEKICDIFSEELPENGMDLRWYDCTVEMALKHRLGLPGGFLDIDCNPSAMFGEDYLNYMFTYPLEYTPNTDKKYSDGAYYLLSRIVEKKTGMDTDNFLWKEMLYKLGFQEMAWSHCPMGHVMGATGLYIHSADMVKLGAVYLNGGTYNGERLISEEWVKLATENEYSLNWDKDRKVYSKGGMRGQKLFVIPSKKLAGAIQSFEGNSDAVAKWIKNYE